jgi:hypothetical protein
MGTYREYGNRREEAAMRSPTPSLTRRLREVWTPREAAPECPVTERAAPAADFATRLRAAVQAKQH